MVLSLHLIALALYGVATALALAPFLGVGAPARVAMLAASAAGAALHVVGVSQLSVVGLAPSLSLLALCLILLQLASEAVLRASAVALFTAPLAAGLVGLALLLVAFIAAALYLLQFRQLKTKHFGQMFQHFPPLERLDRLNQFALVVGFPTLTLGVLLAIGYAVRFAGAVQVDKAQIVWGMFTWVVLGWAVWVRVVRHWTGRRAAFASIAGFAAVLLVYVALKLAAPGAERFL